MISFTFLLFLSIALVAISSSYSPSDLIDVSSFSVELLGAGSDFTGKNTENCGDVNGDGYDDFLTSSAVNSVAYLIYGQSSGAPVLTGPYNSANFTGNVPGVYFNASGSTYFGAGIACGDVNGDGLSDVVIGSVITVSEIRVIFGSPSLPSVIDLSTGYITNETGALFTAPYVAPFRFGDMIAVGDFNGDGYADIFAINNGQVNSWLFLGQQNYQSTIDTSSLNGTEGFEFYAATNLGYIVAGGQTRVTDFGDFNGDGYADLFIRGITGNPSFLVHGFNATFDASYNLDALLGNGTKFTGLAVGGVEFSDIDGDNQVDILISNTPNLYILKGSDSANLANTLAIPGGLTAQNSYSFVWGTNSLSLGGLDASADINGDGINDIAICSDTGHLGTGSVYVLFGSTSFPTSSDLDPFNPSSGILFNGDAGAYPAEYPFDESYLSAALGRVDGKPWVVVTSRTASGSFSFVFRSISCPAGYKFDGFYCSICPNGTYSDSIDSTSCDVCPYGSEPNGIGATNCTWLCAAGKYYNGTGCSNCPANSYSVGGTATCIACPPGSWSASGDNLCTLCLAGEYESGYVCLDCPAGNGSVAGSTSCSACPAGSADLGIGIGCGICQPGTFTNTSGTEGCTPCANGTFNPLSNQQSCPVCQPGSESNLAKDGCQVCPVNQIPVSGVCQACNTGTVTYSTGSIQCLPCPKGTFHDHTSSGTCVTCPIGEYTDAEGETTCASCASGYENFQPGSTLCVAKSADPSSNPLDPTDPNANVIDFVPAIVAVVVVIASVSSVFYMKKKYGRQNTAGQDLPEME